MNQASPYSPSRLLSLLAFSIPFAVLLLTWSLLSKPAEKISASPDEPTRLALHLQELFSRLAHQIRPAVVSVGSTEIFPVAPEGTEPIDTIFNRPEIRRESLGSGLIIDKRGYILTNSHVIGEGLNLKVQLWDGRSAPAQLIQKEDETDVALIKINMPDLVALPMGDSNSLKVGHWVIAVGNPFGLTQTVSTGIISAVGRSEVGLLDYENFIQTDASINQGNSGGPLVNLQGEVIGVNAAIYSGSGGGNTGIGFAIPINLAKALVDRWIEGKHASFLGIVPTNIDRDMAEYMKLKNTRGAFIQNVHDDSPAKEAGLKSKDIIIGFNGTQVKNANHLKVLITRTDDGLPIPVKIRRKGATRIVQVKLKSKSMRPFKNSGKTALGSKSPVAKPILGITIGPLSKVFHERYQIPKGTQGIMIVDVEPGSPADDKNVQVGDLIVEVNDTSVSNMPDFWKALKKRSKGVMMKIDRNNKDLGYFFFKR